MPIFTAGEDERTGVFIHWEIMELQLALCVDGHPGEGEKTQTHLDIQGTRNASVPSFLGPWSTARVHGIHLWLYHVMLLFFFHGSVWRFKPDGAGPHLAAWLMCGSLKMTELFHHQCQTCCFFHQVNAQRHASLEKQDYLAMITGQVNTPDVFWGEARLIMKALEICCTSKIHPTHFKFPTLQNIIPN